MLGHDYGLKLRIELAFGWAKRGFFNLDSFMVEMEMKVEGLVLIFLIFNGLFGFELSVLNLKIFFNDFFY
jgi:hypothetical protein